VRVASFTVHATAEQSARWKRAAEAEGHRSAGTWLAAAADAYLKARARAGAPVPLAWHRGTFLITGRDEDRRARLRVAPLRRLPRHRAGPVRGARSHVLLYLPTARSLATLRHLAQCRSLAAELARYGCGGMGRAAGNRQGRTQGRSYTGSGGGRVAPGPVPRGTGPHNYRIILHLALSLEHDLIG